MSWQHIEDREVKGRKEHKCGLCGHRIRKGAKHIVRSGVTEDGFESFRMHAFCENESSDWDQADWECRGDEADFCFVIGIRTPWMLKRDREEASKC